MPTELTISWSRMISNALALTDKKSAFEKVMRLVLEARYEKWAAGFLHQYNFSSDSNDFEINTNNAQNDSTNLDIDSIKTIIIDVFEIKIWEKKIASPRPHTKPLPELRTEDGIYSYIHQMINNSILDFLKSKKFHTEAFEVETQSSDDSPIDQNPLNSLIDQELNTEITSNDLREILSQVGGPIHNETVKIWVNFYYGTGLGRIMWDFYRRKSTCANLLMRFYTLNPPPGVYMQLKELYNEYKDRSIAALTVSKNDCDDKFSEFYKRFI